MAKRKNIVDSDDDAPILSQASKRARTEDSDDDFAQIPAPSVRRERKPAINGKGKAKDEEVDTDEDEGEDEDLLQDEQPNEEDEKRFEEDHGEAIRRKLEQRRNTIGVRGFKSVTGVQLTRFQEYRGTWYHRVC